MEDEHSLSVFAISVLKMENVYENSSLKSMAIHATLTQPTRGFQQSAEARVCLYKRISLVFACLWLFTLITALVVYSLHQEWEDEKEDYEYMMQKNITEMCYPNDEDKTVRQVFSELTRQNGVILKPVWKWICEASAEVTLDPQTAHASLILSEDRKQVRLGDTAQNVLDVPQRYDPIINVLGKGDFAFGRSYWEVEVGMKIDWYLGVARESVSRKGEVILTPKNGYWTIQLTNRTYLRANAASPVPLPLSLKPQKVGVYVDYEGGQVSFYNVEKRSHIYTFTDTFTDRLCAFFCPGMNTDGMNPGPLIISPIRGKV
ncbi:E3 ubiquitin-protein ligase TRIM39 [Amia ocellicauda]|uniref:E3 ubiquitin-protein ligase TRIM39 n=1 Tax=Amia ocellicauda TaxID=2972642 RepID=UPI00346386B5